MPAAATQSVAGETQSASRRSVAVPCAVAHRRPPPASLVSTLPTDAVDIEQRHGAADAHAGRLADRPRHLQRAACARAWRPCQRTAGRLGHLTTRGMGGRCEAPPSSGVHAAPQT